MSRTRSSSALRRELEGNIQNGRCVYCRRPAEPDEPLTREHVIPRARGGRRKDVRIIVPACASCNHDRGCRELALFLLMRPRRISAFLDYLCTLSADSLREVDLRVFAELYAAVWMLRDCAERGGEWREQLRRICSGRTLHRRRYAARRMVGAVGGRLEHRRRGGEEVPGPGCPVPRTGAEAAPLRLEEPLEQLAARLTGLLALVWEASAEEVQRELVREIEAVRLGAARGGAGAEGVLALDGWKRRRRRRRLRVDRRGGRGRPARGRRAA